ncbi:MAG TPA: SpoIID/LytB domain-containing protein [Patescibacteria group bacterium]
MPTKKIFLLGLALLLSLALFFVLKPTPSHADQLDDINQQLANLNDALNKSVAATKPLQSELDSMQKQITEIKVNVANIEADVAIKKKEIDKGYQDMAEKEMVLSRTIRDFYVKSYANSPLLIFLSSANASEMTQTLAYQRAQTREDKAIITNLALSITDLEKKKASLEQEQKWLIATKADLDDKSAKLDKVVAGARAYQASLSSQISELSAKQQSLLSAKLGSLNIPLFAISGGGCSSDLNPYKDPGFGGKKFGLFSYGVPNRVGLNQYGAFGRAKAGQSSDTILHAYYNFDSYDTSYSGVQIKVNDSNGYDSGNVIWTGSLEDYVKRIYEVPDSWGSQGGLEALKAQTIAARSYVLAETNNGAKSICANQNCQVFQTNPKGGNWEQAANATSGQVMIQGGHPIAAYFSSTHGGYMFSTSDIGWGATSYTKHAQDASANIGSWSDLNNYAYDKDSPWFYCDWGGRSQYNGTAWLTSAEMADIVNSILLVQNDNSTDPHILQTDSSDPEMWDANRVRQELSKYRTPFSSIDSGAVDADFGNGKSTTAHFSGDGGSVDFDSSTFRKYFNLRAPAKIQIVGYLYNLEIR